MASWALNIALFCDRIMSDPFSFGIRNWFGDSALAILCIGFSFYIWTVACGVNRKDEVSAGAVALVVMVLWTVFIAYAVHWFFEPPRSGLIGKFVEAFGGDSSINGARRTS